jgi:hypothetical protein
MVRPLRRLGLCVALVASTALAHPQGFHKRIMLNLSLHRIDGLIAMDVDGGDRCRLVRDGADTNRDAVLQPGEVAALKDKLVRLATLALKLSLSGYPVTWKVKETKLDLRRDHLVTQTGVSVAVLFEAQVETAIAPGTQLQIEDASPDASPVRVDVNQAPADGGVPPPATTELLPGVKWSVRLGPLAPL